MLSDNTPPEIEEEFGPQLDALESAGYRVTDMEFKGPPNGDWVVRLDGPRRLWLTKEDGRFVVDGPRHELEAAGLWQPIDQLEEYWRRLAAYAIGNAVRQSVAPPQLPAEERGAPGAHRGNPQGQKVVGLVVLASAVTTLAVNGLTWSTQGVEGMPVDFVRLLIWSLIWVGLYRGSRGARIAALIFFTLSSASLLLMFTAGAINLALLIGLAFGIVHLVGVIVLLASRPVLEHFAIRR